MSGTYRRAVIYTRDGYYGLGQNARKGAAKTKRVDRRLKRREAAKIEREALAEFEEDCAISRQEALEEYLEAEWYEDDFDSFDDGSRWHDEADYDFPLEGDYSVFGYDDYDDYYSYDYMGYEYQPRLKAPIEYIAEREGKSLGDILSEAISQRREP